MMNAIFVTTLSTQELQELIELSVKNAVQVSPKMSNEDDTLLDTKEAANLIKYEVTSIYGLVKRKKIPFCKIEGKLLFSRRKLIEWIEGGNHAPTLNRPSLPLKAPVTKYR
ncbi:helix-turn-helix domain-containing protein [Mucilaginibacter lappiensis]|uniref:Helix-turn-helix domain-containing protein n=1 Tax=Mucilaginibacter lappiensis TaxID=354630 RepID=A0A841JI04_9SPHI|nr:helix-turn-helix domain-containing protein [Mucilaginibacter lappiensis]MBB6130134.1 hypothetical protein [Mucilaginibacter lappiensis]